MNKHTDIANFTGREPSSYPACPLPDLCPVQADLCPLPGAPSRVVIGAWNEPLFRNATYLVPDRARLDELKRIPFGSVGAIQRVVREGGTLSRDHLIEGGRDFRFLPNLRTGVPLAGAVDIVVIQPQHYVSRELVAFLQKVGAPGARVTLVGYEPFLATEEINAIVLPFLKALQRLNSISQRHFYRRFEKLPLQIENDPAFDQRKERFGTATWRYADAVEYLATLPSMKRLIRAGGSPLPPNVFEQLQKDASLPGLKKAWGGAAKKQEVRFPLIVRSGFINR